MRKLSTVLVKYPYRCLVKLLLLTIVTSIWILKYFESDEIRSMESILQIFAADDLYVKNPILLWLQ